MQLRNLDPNSGQPDTLLLPDDLMWSDEFAWTPAVSTMSYLLTGALLIETALRQKGRPITLTGPADMAWVTRAVVNRLYDWAAQPGQTFELKLSAGQVFTVGFRHHETAIEAEPVTGFSSRNDADYYRVTIRLVEL